MVNDPSCGMDVNPITAKFQSKKGNETFYFCSKDCKDKFDGEKSKTIIPIVGMRCASCVGKIETALKSIGGVKSAVVNLASSKAYVEYDPALVSQSMLRDAIKRSGYESESHESRGEESGKVSLDILGMESDPGWR